MKKTKNKINEISYVYDSNHKIAAVLIPYDNYLQMISDKRSKLVDDMISSETMGYSVLGSTITELRSKGKTLSEIAEVMEISQPYLSKLLKNHVNIGTDTLYKYIKALDGLLDAEG